jgi:hypothetical protein
MRALIVQAPGAPLQQQLHEAADMAEGGAEIVRDRVGEGLQLGQGLLQLARPILHLPLQGLVELADLRPGRLLVRDVAEVEEDGPHRRAFQEVGGGGFHPAPGAVQAAHPELLHLARARTPQEVQEIPQGARGVLRMDEPEGFPLLDLLGIVSEDAGQGGAPVFRAARPVHEEENVLGILDQGAEPLDLARVPGALAREAADQPPVDQQEGHGRNQG